MAKQSGAVAEHGPLTRRDLVTFDGESKALVLEMIDAGWTGRISQRGHAIMRAPDGKATHSVSRESLRGRSGKNARGTFERWKRTHAQAMHPSSKPSSGNVIQLHPDQPAYQDFHPCLVPNCGRTFETAQALSAHKKTHNAWVTCPVCGQPAKVLGQHFRFHHKQLKMADVLAQLTPKPVEAPVEPQEDVDVESPVEDVAEAVAELEAAVEVESEAEPEPVVEVDRFGRTLEEQEADPVVKVDPLVDRGETMDPPPTLTEFVPDPAGLAVPTFEPMEIPESTRAPVVITTTPVTAMDALLQVLTELEALREENARLREWVRNHV